MRRHMLIRIAHRSPFVCFVGPAWRPWSLCALAIAGMSACTTLATSPAWVDGELAETAPLRAAEQEEREDREWARLAAQPKQVGAKHVLVMHAQSKSKPDGVSRSRDQAQARAAEALLKIRSGADFDAIVKEYTDEPGGKERSGDLGIFERTSMVKGFSDAAFALGVGQVSEVIETVYGFHIIKRTE